MHPFASHSCHRRFVMRFLTDLLLGTLEEKTFTFATPRFGVLTATARRRVRPGRRAARSSEWCSWQGQHLLAGQRSATRFHLSGTTAGPANHLVEATDRVLDDLAEIATKASAALARRGAAGSFDDFDLVSISDWDEVDGILQLALVPRGDSGLLTDLRIYWPADDQLSDHHVVFRHAASAPR